MANRSYLYACGRDPSVDLSAPIRGISEANSAIPLMHKLLVSEGARVAPSQVWDGGLALVGDFEGGLRRAQKVFEQLAKRGSAEAAEVVGEMTAFFADVKDRGFFMLEIVEIYELRGEDPIAGAHEVLAEVEAMRARVDGGIDSALFDELRESVAQDDQGWWSEHLYFAIRRSAETIPDEGVPDEQLDPVYATAPIKLVTVGKEYLLLEGGVELPECRDLVIPYGKDLRVLVGERVLLVPKLRKCDELDMFLDLEKDGTGSLRINDESYPVNVPVRVDSSWRDELA